MFLQADVQKTGKNMHLSFKYFELDDIVPNATRIFSEVGLIPIVNFTSDVATMKIVNIDNPDEEYIPFVAPFNQIAPIISNAGKQATNEMQALGSSITYMRRYLWQLVLDIIEADSIDNTSGADEDTQTPPSPPKSAKKAPVTAEKRQEIKSELTSAPEGAASEEQVATLKAELKKLMELDAEQESFVQNVAVKTEGFTKITADVCDQLITGVRDMLSAYDTQEG